MDPPEKRVLRLIAEPRNRAILTVLNDAARSLSVSELVERLVRLESDTLGWSDENPDRETVHISLHHNNLPKLDEADLVEYDRSEKTVSYESYPAVDVELMEIDMIDELLSCFSSGTDVTGDAIGVIDGREEVIEYGRHLIDEAETELFLMSVSEELLEDECHRRIETSLERDVDVSLGSRDRDVRERARDRLPGVTIWEPQLDWLNAPSQYPKVGRLVFADREKIMLAVLKETDVGGETTEMAVIGEGETNPLVVLVRQLLGPRLDHLDYQSEDFLDELPFEP
ncbi:DUF7344 domain-containing protein [Natrarchaeobius chitinivorans]|uniref:ArsR family transcriptional regulator n=1 Tax=Natrarchaeobius chitinivorans TaxID=1679083 RepID=A0A3N6LUB1_NATCH|nr:ArsR family transcriptional regulator [Natrarchaeobius chitinivorans]RQG93868.1 ArsR family transcriptional regulator [Natrarchaeobius chitinivorans]